MTRPRGRPPTGGTDKELTQQIAAWWRGQRLLAWATTDEDMVITAVSGDILGPGSEPAEADGLVGRGLLDAVPELGGLGDRVQAVLADRAAAFGLPMVQRGRPDTAPAFVNLLILPRRDGQGRIVGLLHLVEDAGLVGEMLRTLNQSHCELRLANEQLDERVMDLELRIGNSNYAQTSNTRLMLAMLREATSGHTGILTYAETLLADAFDALTGNQRAAIQAMADIAWEQTSVMEDMADLHYLSDHDLRLVLEPTVPATLVLTVLRRQRPLIASRRQVVETDLPAELPLVLCDSRAVELVLRSLVISAVWCASAASRIQIRVTPADAPGFLRLMVTDDDAGPLAERRLNVMSQLASGVDTLRASDDRVLLGLPVAAALLENHGGSLGFTRHAQDGFTTWITLPIAQLSNTALDDPTQPPVLGPPATR